MDGRFGGGDGSANNPYLIEDADDLNAIRNHLSSSFKLVNDINLGNGKYNIELGWKPIDKFSGTFNGDMHKICNLYINRPAQNNVGLFGYMDAVGVNVSNVEVIDADITGYNNVGILIGYWGRSDYKYTHSDTLSNNIYVTGKVYGNSSVSGVIGQCYAYEGSDQWSAYYSIYTFFNNAYSYVYINSNNKVAYGIGNFCGSNGSHGTVCHYINNCCAIIKKNNNLSTVYGISSNNYISCSNCYVNNTEFSPIIYGGISYVNLMSLVSSNAPLNGLPYDIYEKEINTKLALKSSHQNSIYIQLNDGYYVYDFTNYQLVRQYRFLNNDDYTVLNNGMARMDFNKIPNAVWKQLSEKYSSINIVDCIFNHDKIIKETKSVTLVQNTDVSSDKNIFSYKFLKRKWDPIMSITNAV